MGRARGDVIVAEGHRGRVEKLYGNSRVIKNYKTPSVQTFSNSRPAAATAESLAVYGPDFTAAGRRQCIFIIVRMRKK